MRILVAIDGNSASEAALACVCQHKWPEQTQIKLVYVLNKSGGVFKKTKGASPSLTVDATRLAIEEIAERISQRVAYAHITCDVTEGDPKAVIVKLAKQWIADLIVMGTRNKTNIDQLIPGSVSKAVLQKADCPVLLIKNGRMAGHIKHGEDFTRILVASDGKEASKSAFAWLANQDWSNEVVYKVMSVVPQESTEIESAGDAQKAAWLLRQWSAIKEKVLTGLRKDASLLGKGLDNEYISVDVIPGNPKDKVVDIAKGWRAELIVTGAEPKSQLDKFFQVSISQAIASSAPCSVLVVKGLDKNGVRMTDKKKLKAGSSQDYAGKSVKQIKQKRDLPADNDDGAPFKMF